MEVTEEALAAMFAVVSAHLDERQRLPAGHVEVEPH
jgi:hypothetical protein